MGSSPLLLVDGHNLLWGATFGFPAAIWSTDKTRNLTGVFAFFALLRKTAREEIPDGPAEIIVVFDGEHGGADRKAADANYKANRPTDDAALAPLLALPDVKRGLDLYGIPWIEHPQDEADDVIASLVHHVARTDPGRTVLLHSRDRDFYQLITDTVRVLNTKCKPKILGPEDVEARFRVTPSQWSCFRALTGDTADNIVACPALVPAPPPSS